MKKTGFTMKKTRFTMKKTRFTMKKTLLGILFALISTIVYAYPIVLPQDASIQEQRAAGELEKYLNLLSDGAAKDAATPVVHVGRSDEALKVFGLSSWGELKPDEVLYRVTEDGDLWIAGEGRRGAIYAVYELLEREYGVRFLTSECEYVPVKKPFALPPVGTSHRYASPFITRCAAFDSILALGGGVPFSPDFVAKSRTNFFASSQPEEWGGQDGIIGFCHTMCRLVPESNFADHPEWFALSDGERQTGQPCLTNHEMRQELIKNTLEWLRQDNGASHFISVSQNDNIRYCTCPDCEAFVKEHGNQTDLLIDCVNEVADAVKKEFPNVFVKTLAYQYTRQPPKTVRPRDNVAILYCTIEVKPFYCLESPENQIMANEVTEWLKIAPKMMFWHYITNFGKYYLPRGNWRTLAKDIRFFRDSRGIHIFEQGNHNAAGRAADVSDLRAYVVSRLIWNPDLDENELFDEFLSLFYGPAEKYVRRYLDGVERCLQNHPSAADPLCPPNISSWMTDEELAGLWKSVFEGVEALAGDAVYGPRMAVAALPITMALLERSGLLTLEDADRLPMLRGVNALELVDWCEKTLEIAGAKGLSEGEFKTEVWISKMRRTFNDILTLPDAPVDGIRPPEVPDGQLWYAWNAEAIGILINAGKNTISVMDDSAATGGKAVQMPATHNQWYLQLHDLPGATCDIYVECRCDLKPGCTAEGKAMTFGYYPSGPVVEGAVDAADMVGTEYKRILLGRSDLADGGYLYCAPVINPNVERIWIDRLIFTNLTNANGKPFK